MKKKRLFCAILLLLMAVLAVHTMAMAESGSPGSYSLTIQKVFAEGTPADVLAAAAKQKYTFRVQAEVKGEDAPVEKVVHITGQGATEVSFGNAFKVSVIEQTDDGGFKIGTDKWDVSDTECLSTMHVNASSATLSLSKDNSAITITRPANVPTVTFQLIGEPLGDKNAADYSDKKAKFDAALAAALASSNQVTVAASQSAKFTGLPAGQYTITKLRSADGFNVLVGERTFGVGAGETGTVYINGTKSQLQITAPGKEEDGRTHYYQIKKNGRIVREIEVLSGETYTVENLDEGEYTIEVYQTYDGVPGFKVKYPSTSVTEREVNTNKVTSSSNISSYTGYSLLDAKKKRADQVEVYSYGPVYDKDGKPITTNVTYKVNWGIRKIVNGELDKGVTRSDYRYLKDKKGSLYYTISGDNLKRLTPGNNYLYFAITSVSDPNVAAVRVKWREYRETVKEATVKEAATLADGKLVTVNGLTENYIIIEKPADDNVRGGDVKYYYTIEDSNHNPVTGITITDLEGKPADYPTGEEFNGNPTTVTLKAGQSVKISGLKNGGNYRIFENIQKAPAMGFTVKLVDTTKEVTTSGGTITITTLDARTVNISRPGKRADDNDRVYTYKVYKDVAGGEDELINTFTLHSGESTTMLEQTGHILPAGTYRIKAVDDAIAGFDVAFTDSSSLTSDYIGTAKVTFTNQFSKVVASYHVIHEYYLQNDDGSYTFEGASPVYTKNCDHEEVGVVGHTAAEVHPQEVHKGNTYEYQPALDAYGRVVSWEKEAASKTVELKNGEEIDFRFAEGENTLYNRAGSNGMGTKDDPGTRDYDYVPVAGKTSVMATKHQADKAHEHGAEIIILRYVRSAKVEERGKYNIVHVYYRRTSKGDVLEGVSPVQPVDVGILTPENRYETYDAKGVEKVPDPDAVWGDKWWTDEEELKGDYVYQYDGASYGKIVEDDGGGGASGSIPAGQGNIFRQDDNMTSVKATAEGDQIIVLRYYRTGGYNVVHEYYFREKANEDAGETEETPGADGGVDGGAGEQSAEPHAESGESQFSGTLTSADGYAYDYEGSSAVSKIPASLDGWYDADGVSRQPGFKPEGQSQQYTYTYKDAVYGYLDEDGTYRAAPYKTGAASTEQIDEIIILRYYREDAPPVTPPPSDDDDDEDPIPLSYRVVHEYYFRDPDGSETLEGVSEIETVQAGTDASLRYTADSVTQVPEFRRIAYTYKECAYGRMRGGSEYGAVDGKSYVTATGSGAEIIILRYVRSASYRVVHEYYLQYPNGERALEGVSDIRQMMGELRRQYTAGEVQQEPVFQERTYSYENCAYGRMDGESYAPDSAKAYVLATGEGEEIIILRYVRTVPLSYRVVHEYYFRDRNGEETLEGVSDLRRLPGENGVRYVPEDVAREPDFGGRTYAYLNSACGRMDGEGYAPDGAKTHVLATENGEEVLILRYVREDEAERPPVTPPELPDPNDPDSPDEITIEEDGVPKTYVKVWDPEEEEFVYILEDEVPLANTGDGTRTGLWAALFALSGGGIAVLTRKRRERE